MYTLYPDIKTNHTYTVEVDRRHCVYVEESGNPDGIPVVFVHGGPGGGCSRQDRCFFDPEEYRIILFDQRGCGRSTPHADLTDNTTQHLIADMEIIREHLQIERWCLFGGSWGSTLSLAYAQTHPERVTGLILRGIFLCRSQDIHWFYQSGASRVFPDYWQDFIEPIPEAEHRDLLSAYYRRLTSHNEIERMNAAKAWSLWEGRCATLHPNHDVVERFSEPHLALSLARIEAHYFTHNAFLDDNQLLNNMHLLDGIPGVIVHGRYDIVCSVDNAWALHQAWPDSELCIVRDAGHSSRELGTVDALIRATRNFVRVLSGSA